MADAGYIIQPLDNSNYSLLVPLMKDCFAMDVSADYFKWKYFDNPAGTCIGFLAIEKKTNNGAAFYGAMPQRYIIDGKEMTIYQACDTMTHTQHRKKSLFPILAQECYRSLQDRDNFRMIGIGGSEQSFPVLKHFGWKIIFNFRNYFKPAILCRLSFLKNYPKKDFVLESSLGALEKIITEQANSSAIRSPRNMPHYRWRISNPNYKYQVVSYRTRNSVSGFIVFYVQGDKIFLFDFKFGNARARRALLWYLSRIVVKNNYKGIIAFCQEGGDQSRELKKGGFVSNPFKKGPLSGRPPFLVYGDEEALTKLSDAEKWSVTAYDYDAS